ncbi:MAG TPA: TrkA family potassium uptake protein [Candidatus Omnitrophica bacterium]|nr:TrkA family potassium uptake protein [Candidatus Omnitrophota bacterium]
MYIIIVGCGETGSKLAEDFSLGKDNVVVIDKNPRALSFLGPRFNGRTIVGDGLDLKILEEAGIKNADYLFVLTGKENTNLVIAQIGKKIYKVKKVIVQVQSFLKEEIFKKKGLITINRKALFLDTFKKCIS